MVCGYDQSRAQRLKLRSQLCFLPPRAKHFTAWWLSFSIYMTGIWTFPPLLLSLYILGIEVDSHHLSANTLQSPLPRASVHYFSQLLRSVCIYLGYRINMPQTCRCWIWRPASFQFLAWEKSAVVAPGTGKSKVQRSCTEPAWGSRDRTNKRYWPKAARYSNMLLLLLLPLSSVSQPSATLDNNIIIYSTYELYNDYY